MSALQRGSGQQLFLAFKLKANQSSSVPINKNFQMKDWFAIVIGIETNERQYV